eukprot:gene14835-biopygen20138
MLCWHRPLDALLAPPLGSFAGTLPPWMRPMEASQTPPLGCFAGTSPLDALLAPPPPWCLVGTALGCFADTSSLDALLAPPLGCFAGTLIAAEVRSASLPPTVTTPGLCLETSPV